MLAVQVDSGQPEPSTLRPVVTKTFLKGAIAIGVFSIFLNVNPSTYVNFLIFLALMFGFLTLFVLLKRETTFEVGDDKITVRRMMRQPKVIPYSQVRGVVISQGTLAKRFRCGSVFLLLKGARGNARVMGGGGAERLEDVPDPDGVCELVTSRLGILGPEDA